MNKQTIILIIISLTFFGLLGVAIIGAEISQNKFEEMNEKHEKNNDFYKLKINENEDIEQDKKK